jgi:lysophospholipase L1-like esterase
MIISLGANDYKGIDTDNNIRRLRESVKADRVFWLLPSQKLKPEQVRAVKFVAIEYGDTVIPRPEKDISADGVHPTFKGYKVLGDLTR